jgi:aerobic carbon-monoxide dehydrogenase medium subunit
VKPAPFEYLLANSVDEAVRALADAAGDSKILAGGQSLVPLMALRMAHPSLLVDINRIPGIAGISRIGSLVRVGALTRHRALVEQREHPLLAEAARWIGHPAIRSRGTVGGSIAHADPAAELPVVAVALDAVVRVTGPRATREVTADALYTGALRTSLADDEVVTAVDFPLPQRWGFAEFSRRHGDFALVTAVVAEIDNRTRIAIGGTGGIPRRAASAEAVLGAGPLTPEAIKRAADLAADDIDAEDDTQASAAYRRAMVREFTRKALHQLLGEPIREGT